MDDSYEPTIQQLLDVAKRVMGNGINWRFVREASAMPLADLVAMSVGLEGSFVEAVEEATTPSPDTPIDEIAEMLAYRDADVEEVRHRRAIAFIRLSAGDGLHPAIGEIDGYNTAVSVPEFAAFAQRMGWELPPEFPKPLTAPASMLVETKPPRTRTDGLSKAMEIGFKRYEQRYHSEPTARALFDWLANNDETGKITELDTDKDVLTWTRSDGGLSDTSFSSFQGRFTKLRRKKT